ncbi:expressed protein, partial [Phakopsora pachyrhizi]
MEFRKTTIFLSFFLSELFFTLSFIFNETFQKVLVKHTHAETRSYHQLKKRQSRIMPLKLDSIRKNGGLKRYPILDKNSQPKKSIDNKNNDDNFEGVKKTKNKNAEILLILGFLKQNKEAVEMDERKKKWEDRNEIFEEAAIGRANSNND